MECYGAHCVYVTDSAGYMLPGDVRVRLGAVRDALKPETELGFHGHHNLAMGVANSIAAIEVGANRIDAAAAGLGAGWRPALHLDALAQPRSLRDATGGCAGGRRSAWKPRVSSSPLFRIIPSQPASSTSTHSFSFRISPVKINTFRTG